MNDFVTMDYLSTFAGMVLVVGLIVQLTKGMVKRIFADELVRIYAFIWSLVIVTVIYQNQGLYETGSIAAGALLTVVNAAAVTLAAIGGYDVLAHRGR